MLSWVKTWPCLEMTSAECRSSGRQLVGNGFHLVRFWDSRDFFRLHCMCLEHSLMLQPKPVSMLTELIHVLELGSPQWNAYLFWQLAKKSLAEQHVLVS